MCTPLAKLAIGLSATMATGLYYLAAAPPAGAAVDVCGPGNFSSACVPNNTASPKSPTSSTESLRAPAQTSPAAVQEPVTPLPIVQSPTPEPVPPLPIVQSPTPEPVPPLPVPTPDLVPLLPEINVPAAASPNPIAPVPAPAPAPAPAPPPTFQNIYTNTTTNPRATSIPEPGTVAALLATGVGIICSGRKRNKQVGQPR
ncbi:PEP-CTERM sorting domain-containing protein [Tychonema sp. LEGE 07203]|uniref:PEP-CTERM sorting domain-containing protein n=1 Tax=Tychonema sp. LEGE 07203 TaxID=1828671 RepID=UPI001D1453CA|nr:PEP-CTERM sorting domain-containing protein [Tychonema sp. LEGE 07203]